MILPLVLLPILRLLERTTCRFIAGRLDRAAHFGVPLVLALACVVSAARSAAAQPAAPQPEPPSAAAPPPTTPSEPATAEAAQEAEALADQPLAGPPPDEMERARGSTIVGIEVAGNNRISSGDALGYLRERQGQLFKPELLTEDVRELWRSGFFDSIEVDLSHKDAGVTLRFLVRERPNVASITISGNEEVETDDITSGIELKSNSVLSHPAIGRSIQKIRDMYAEHGYFLAEVESEITPLKNNEVSVTFKVTEHSQVSVKRITFIGNNSVPEEELRATMYTGATSLLAFGSGGPFRQDAFERDIAVISALYYDRGFLSVNIATPRIMLTPDKSGIEVTITVEEGPRFRIRRLRVYEKGADGREVEPIGGRRALRMMVRAEPGDYFNRAELLDDLQTVRSLYRNHGYALVEANPETNLDPERREVDITVPIVRGPPVYFERIEVRGNSKTRDKVIRRELEVDEGRLFSEIGIERSRQRVNALGYFERVDVSTEEGSAPNRMNLYIEVAEKATGTFQVGAGFSSVENFIATAQIQQANVFGNGQSVSLQAQLSTLRQQINLQFIEPYFLDTDFSTSIDLYDQLRVFNDFSQETRGGSLSFGYPLVDPELRASLTYTLELDRVSTEAASTFFGGSSSAISVFRRLPLANLFSDGITSSFRPGLTFDTRDNRLFPTSGIFINASTELASDIFASENEFLRHRLKGLFYYPLGGGLVLKLQTQLGHVTSPTQEGVPIFARFFLGGILDLRGFPFRSVGPRMPLTDATDPNSTPVQYGASIGGNLSYIQNLEIEFPIFEEVGLRGVVFTDAGNAWNLEPNYCKTGGPSITDDVSNPCFDGAEALLRLRTSWGFGFRWFSPLGPLRFEWGFPFAPLEYEESSVFEFTIGNFF